MKSTFAFHHYHYKRWDAVALFDLMALNYTCPDIYFHFLSDNFLFQKFIDNFQKWLLVSSTRRIMNRLEGSTEPYMC